MIDDTPERIASECKREGWSPHVCTECRIHHVQNCRVCAGFGLRADGSIYITAGEAHDGPLPDWKTCPMCGGTPRGIRRYKTSELIGDDLDYFVDVALGREEIALYGGAPPYSTDWAIGGPIIERERIYFDVTAWPDRPYAAMINPTRVEDEPTFADYMQCGPTHLVAAMRCFVESRLGKEVTR